MSTLDNSAISKVLGQRVSAPAQYDKSILVRELRQNNRTYLGIKEDALPFVGVDVWNNWEISALTDEGLPVTGIAKIMYSCDSKYIVESKSAKLYYNSFNMTKFGKTTADVLSNIENTSAADLSEFLETDVKVSIRKTNTYCAPYRSYTNDALLLDNILPSLQITDYNENPDLLNTNGKVNTGSMTQTFCSSLLRSNCRVTNQPDAGDVHIKIKTDHIVDPIGLLKYIISFRNENHFHEEICEAIYMRLLDKYTPDELLVECFYVRRGSLDINPARASREDLLSEDFRSPTAFYVKTTRQ
jgi:7-cyano-7-deazaguanine reductase